MLPFGGTAKRPKSAPRELRQLPTLIQTPTRIQAAGNLPKLIDEYVGRVNTREARLSIAHMRSPAGWREPAQKPEFEEYTIVLSGRLHVQHHQGSFEVVAGQAVIAHAGEWVQYSTPDEATEYIAICMPAFSPDTVHRDGKTIAQRRPESAE
jgi:mannose-6-phosphate isomerase-like protein (cupin superfamily)